MKREKRAAISSKMEKALDMPVGALSETARFELSGNRQVLIEGCQGIVKYDEDQIQLRTVGGTVRFTGRELCMTSLNPACAVITGRLLSLEFL